MNFLVEATRFLQKTTTFVSRLVFGCSKTFLHQACSRWYDHFVLRLMILCPSGFVVLCFLLYDTTKALCLTCVGLVGKDPPNTRQKRERAKAVVVYIFHGHVNMTTNKKREQSVSANEVRLPGLLQFGVTF